MKQSLRYAVLMHNLEHYRRLKQMVATKNQLQMSGFKIHTNQFTKQTINRRKSNEQKKNSK